MDLFKTLGEPWCNISNQFNQNNDFHTDEFIQTLAKSYPDIIERSIYEAGRIHIFFIYSIITKFSKYNIKIFTIYFSIV